MAIEEFIPGAGLISSVFSSFSCSFSFSMDMAAKHGVHNPPIEYHPPVYEREDFFEGRFGEELDE